MKIYSRTAFMELPEGVLFVKGGRCHFGGELCRKGDTIRRDGRGIDWFYTPTATFDYQDTGQFVERFDEMADGGASYPLDTETGSRDGCFDDADMFLVYERADLARLAAVIGQAVAPDDAQRKARE